MIRTYILLTGLLLCTSSAWGGEKFSLPALPQQEEFGNIITNRTSAKSGETFSLPTLPQHEEFGNVIMNRNSAKNGILPVAFSHWKHRTKYTCRVCHVELEFSMKANTTEMREVDNRKGKFCGACHNGKRAFKLNGNCEKCHSGDIGYNSEKYAEFAKNKFPRTSFDGGINWVEALKAGLISPQNYLKTDPGDIPFDKNLNLEAAWGGIASAVFSHKTHMGWLECSSCHPDIFNIKKKTTAHLTMDSILKRKFCGACHLTVAFPINDCKRCHPGIARN